MIETNLKLVDQIRKRPAMYTGDISIRGVKCMLESFLDEVAKNNPDRKEVLIEFKESNRIKIEVNDIDTSSFIQGLVDLDKTGGYSYSELPVLIALSEDIKVNVQKLPSLTVLQAKRGIYEMAATTATEKRNKITIEFKIDSEIFKDVKIDYEIMNQSLRKYAFLYHDYKITSIDSSTGTQQINVFDYPNGLSHELDYKIGKQLHGVPMLRLEMKKKIGDYEYQIAFAYQNIWLGQTDVTTYANYHELIHGGSFIEGILEGIVSALNEIANQRKLRVNVNVNNVKEQLMLVASVKGSEFRFGGSTRTSLEMPKLREDIHNFVFQETLNHLKKDEDAMFKVLQKYSVD